MVGGIAFLGAVAALLDTDTRNAQHVTETPLLAVDDLASLRAHAAVENVDADGDWLRMGGRANAGSVVAFHEEHGDKEWAVEMRVRRPKMAEQQHAGLLVWATKQPVTGGKFLGGAAKFTGFATGLLFSKNRTDFAFSYNDGLDLTDLGSLAMQREPVDPSILKGVEELTVKVVHTSRNFIIELYDGERLISDSFRVNDVLLAGEAEVGPHLGLTTFYDGSPAAEPLRVAHVTVLDRKESEDYDATASHLPLNTYKHSESSAEVAQAVAHMKHFTTYLQNALVYEGSNLLDTLHEDLQELTRRVEKRIDALIAQEAEAQEVDAATADTRGSSRIDRFDAELLDMHIKLEQLKVEVARARQTAMPSSIKTISNMLLVFSALAAAVVVGKQIAMRVILRSPAEKKRG
ncbi:hypothetical protein PAPHI01_0542 [Pancytospora philotis]|nr:hypothetical protein PAPHI01_0542 [Pancytospora philotis]